jgi:predicted ATP-grasp superfamily ATP-dependent carboligase
MTESKKVEVMLQEIIQGPATNSIQLEGYFDKKFQSKSMFARQRLRIYPLDFGNTTLCASMALAKVNSECEKLADFIKNIRYSGLASAEYKKDPKDGKYKMLEINARVWFHSWLSAKCGINILIASYLDAFGEKTDFKRPYPTGVKSIHIDYDFLSSKNMFQRRELGITDWLSSIKGVRQAALLDLNDSFPFFAHNIKKISFLKKIQSKGPIFQKP